MSGKMSKPRYGCTWFELAQGMRKGVLSVEGRADLALYQAALDDADKAVEYFGEASVARTCKNRAEAMRKHRAGVQSLKRVREFLGQFF